MIKASALLAAVAIGLLVAGVLTSSLLMVYVSIAVCAVAALILAAGIVTHWSEIFGRGESRPASVPGAWSAPQAGVSGLPVLASAVSTAAAGGQERHDEAGGPPAGEHAEAVRPQQESPAAARSDDLWERVEEELGSAGKRDTGALSWPAIELPVFRESPGSPGQAVPPGEGGPRDSSPAGSSAWMWGQGAGWKPPETSDPAWPPPAAAFAGSPAGPEPAQDADGTSPDQVTGQDAAGPDDTTSARAEPAAGEAAEPASDAAEGDTEVPESGTAEEEPPAKAPAGDSAAGEPAREDAAGGKPAAAAARDSAAGEPAAGDSAAGEPAAGDSVVTGPAAGDTAAGKPAGDKPVAGGPAAGGSAAAEPGKPAAAEPAAGPGRIEVTVVPGVARYHRSGCILIRFLGADDLEIMTRQEAEEATFVPCRACQPDQLEA